MNVEDTIKLKDIASGLSKLPFVKAIVLFGSQANGKAREDSDIDLAVITGTISKEQRIEILGCSSEKFDISLFSDLPLIIQLALARDILPALQLTAYYSTAHLL